MLLKLFVSEPLINEKKKISKKWRNKPLLSRHSSGPPESPLQASLGTPSEFIPPAQNTLGLNSAEGQNVATLILAV